MHTQGIRLQLKQMDESVHSIIARAALDELLFKAGSGFHKLTNEEVTGVIAGCIQAYNELFKEGNHEYSRKTYVNSIQTESTEEPVQQLREVPLSES